MTTTTFKEYVERIAIFVVMTVIFIYIVNPILLDVAPILAFQSGDGFDRRTGGLGLLSYLATLVIGVYIYYIAIISIIEDGLLSFTAFMLLILLIIIPNKMLPEKYYPGTIGQQDIEDWLASRIPLAGSE